MSTVREALDGLTFGSDLNKDAMVSDAIVVARTVDAETGRPEVFVAVTEGTDIIVTLGLVEALRQIQNGEWDGADDA